MPINGTSKPTTNELWDDEHLNPHDGLYEEETENSSDTDWSDDDDSLSTGESSDSGKKKKKTKRKKLRYNEDMLCEIIENNHDHALVLHALYVHRRLTINQISTLFFSSSQLDKLRSSIRRLHLAGLLERKRVFAVAQTMADARTYHYSLSPLGIRVYALACMKLSMLHENADLPKQHYSHGDLMIGSQADHHFILQGFLTETLGKLWDKNIFIPNSEWRRFLFLDEFDQVPYRPDWILFEPSDFFNQLAGEHRMGEDILSVPVLTRNEKDLQIIKSCYHPIISIECDTGTMRPDKLKVKIVRIQNAKSVNPPCTAILVGEGKLGEERVRTRSDSRVRIRNIGIAIRDVIEMELITDELIFLIGRSDRLSETVSTYIVNQQKMGTIYSQAISLWKVGFPKHTILEVSEWKQRMIEAGLPDISLLDSQQKQIIAIFYAYPGWLNPQVKVSNLLDKTSDDVLCVFLYPRKDDFPLDVHLSLSMRIQYAALDEWEAGSAQRYVRTVDRRGEHWEVSTHQ